MLRFETIGNSDIDKYVNSKKAIIIDLRDRVDYEKAHIMNAINIPYEQIERGTKKMPKEYILIFYCESGGRGLMAAKYYYDKGYITKALMRGFKNYDGKYREEGTSSH